MSKCKWEQDEVCVNADCPLCADFCPVSDVPGVCRFEDRGTETKDPICTKTNADCIRSMTDEELAHFWETRPDTCPPIGTLCSGKNCYDCWLEWLKQEAEE